MFTIIAKTYDHICAQSLTRYQQNVPCLILSSFFEKDAIRICDLCSKPSPALSILISKVRNISLQTVSCWFSSYTASYVGLLA